MAPKIFISYRHEDGHEAADILDAMLKRAGLDTLRDTRFAEGSHLDDAVLRGLATADLVVFLVTPRWGGGEWVRRELRYVRAVGKRALHVFVGEDSSLKSIREIPAFSDVWGNAEDAEHARYLKYFPWLHVSITHINELHHLFIPILRALEPVPIVDWPRPEQFLPLRADLPDKFVCLTEKGLSDAVCDLMPGNSAVVVPTSRAFDLNGAVSAGVCKHLGIDRYSLTQQSLKATREQALGYGIVHPPNDFERRQFFLIAATAFDESGAPHTSESLQRRAVRHALEVATLECGCVAAVLPLFGTGPHVGLPVHQATRALLSEIFCFMFSHKGPLAVAVSVPTSGRDRHIQHGLNYVRLLTGSDVPQRLPTSIRFRLRGSPKNEIWMSRGGTVRQLATQLLGSAPESLHPQTRCYAWAGNKPVASRGGQGEPYWYDLNTKVGDMVFCDGEIISFETDTPKPVTS